MVNCTLTMLDQPMHLKRIHVVLSIDWQVSEALKKKKKEKFPWKPRNRSSAHSPQWWKIINFIVRHHFLCFALYCIVYRIDWSYHRWHTSINISRTNYCEWAERFSAATHECRETFVTSCCIEWTNYIAMHSTRTSCTNVSVGFPDKKKKKNSAIRSYCRLHLTKQSKTKNTNALKPKTNFYFFCLFVFVFSRVSFLIR